MTLTATAPAQDSGSRFKVLLVDDSVVVRGMVSRWIAETGDLELAGMAVNGEQALKKAEAQDYDLCVLDVEMPVMGGLEALPKLLALRPRMKVVMCSTLTREGGAVTLRALDLGAADFVAKPEASRLGGALAFRDELFGKLRRLGEAGVRRAAAPRTPAPVPAAPPRPPAAAKAFTRPQITLIGSSTGGPPALRTLLAGMGPAWPTPILIVQHMPATFTKILAEHLTKGCGLPVSEAVEGQSFEPGQAYVAPGDWHLSVRRGTRPSAHLDQDPAENWCRPAVDKLFRSAAATYGAGCLAIILTGMGHDGRDGARDLAAKGAAILAQDEASSVVWGMPGAVVTAGLADEIRPLADLAESAWAIVRGGRP